MLIRKRKRLAVILLSFTALLYGCGNRENVSATAEETLQNRGNVTDAYVMIQEEEVPLSAVPGSGDAEATPATIDESPLQEDAAQEAELQQEEIQQPVPTQEVEVLLEEDDVSIEVIVETGEEVVQPETKQPETKQPETKQPEEAFDASAFSAGVCQAVNDTRKAAGLSELSTTPELSAAASKRAAEIAGSFSHTRPGGADYSTAVTEAGGSFGSIGENLFSGMQSVTAVQNAWNDSQIHLENIMNSGFTHIGIGVAETPNGICVVQIFTD
ncbi:MAG: hypothetical protein IJD96_05740 [Lachnospiraceae bacterium]|nr:hypothetical protein [Lachnospiraceae bacterium]